MREGVEKSVNKTKQECRSMSYDEFLTALIVEICIEDYFKTAVKKDVAKQTFASIGSNIDIDEFINEEMSLAINKYIV